MKKEGIICYILISCIFIIWGCVPPPEIPTSSYPVQIQKKYGSSFEKAWQSVVHYVKSNNATIISEDKTTGVITFKNFNSESQEDEYINVYLKRDPLNETTIVYIRPWTAFWTSKRKSQIIGVRPSLAEATEHNFFNDLDKILGVE